MIHDPSESLRKNTHQVFWHNDLPILKDRCWADIALQLQAHPNQWAYIGPGSRALHWKLTNYRIKSWPSHNFDVIHLDDKKMESQLWARYIGPHTTTTQNTSKLAPILDAIDQLAQGIKDLEKHLK